MSRRFLFKKQTLLACLVFTFFCGGLNAQSKAECETLLFIEEDGSSYKKYVDIRTDNLLAGARIYNNIKKGKDPKETYLYVNPHVYEFVEHSTLSYNQMIFEGDSYSFMEKGNLKDDGELNLADGAFEFSNDARKQALGHYGYYWQNGVFTKFSFTWIFPNDFKILEKSCNQKGEWIAHDNSLTFYGEDLNNIVFNIKYSKTFDHDLPSFKGRDVNVVETISMKQENVSIEVWDNNQEDGDIISLSLNGEYLCKNLEVKKNKVQFKVPNLQGKNLLILHAENLGEIPPNTAAIKIISGDEVKEVVLNSDQGKSEAIQILIDP